MIEIAAGWTPRHAPSVDERAVRASEIAHRPRAIGLAPVANFWKRSMKTYSAKPAEVDPDQLDADGAAEDATETSSHTR